MRNNWMKSSLCKQSDLENTKFIDMCKTLKTAEWFEQFGKTNHIVIPKGILHRKAWEYAFIALALEERGMLKPGKRGLGFAVGTEPLPAYFAAKGCEIVATDLNAKEAGAWSQTGQNTGGDIKKLNSLGICPKPVFEKKVSYRDADMNDIPADLMKEEFDFCWSSCAIEHVGSLKKSKMFLKNMLKTLKPGGIAIHTTEYNLSSNTDTIEDGESVIWRKKDVLEVIEDLKLIGGGAELDFSEGDADGDHFVDTFPYYTKNPKYHLRLLLDGYTSTSFGFIIQKQIRPMGAFHIKKVFPIVKENLLQLEEDNIKYEDKLRQLKSKWENSQRKVEQLEKNCELLARTCSSIRWRVSDYFKEFREHPEDAVSCLLCGFTQEREKYQKKKAECIFGGGMLERYECPVCGAIFGPSKFLDLPSEEQEEDYTIHYMGYSKGDSTEKEIAAFQMLHPTKEGIYLNYGCGSWSRTIERLRAQGYKVFGYDAYSSSGADYIITDKEELKKWRFDGIFTNNLLEHLTNPVSDFQFFKSLLKGPKALMAHATPCYEYAYEYTRFHTCFFTGNSIAYLCDKANVEMVERQEDRKLGDFICCTFRNKDDFIDYTDQMVAFERSERQNPYHMVLHANGIVGGPYVVFSKGAYRWDIEFAEGGEPFAVKCRVTADAGRKVILERQLTHRKEILEVALDEITRNFEIVFYNMSGADISLIKVRLISAS